MGQYSLENFRFKEINFNSDSKNKKSLLVGTQSDFPENIKPNYIVNYPNQSVAYYLIETQ